MMYDSWLLCGTEVVCVCDRVLGMQWREMHGTWPGSSCPDISLKLLTSSGTVTAL